MLAISCCEDFMRIRSEHGHQQFWCWNRASCRIPSGEWDWRGTAYMDRNWSSRTLSNCSTPSKLQQWNAGMDQTHWERIHWLHLLQLSNHWVSLQTNFILILSQVTWWCCPSWCATSGGRTRRTAAATMHIEGCLRIYSELGLNWNILIFSIINLTITFIWLDFLINRHQFFNFIHFIWWKWTYLFIFCANF